MTAIDDLYITNLCEDKIMVSSDVFEEINRLRTHCSLKITMFDPSRTKQSIQLCFLNATIIVILLAHEHLI